MTGRNYICRFTLWWGAAWGCMTEHRCSRKCLIKEFPLWQPVEIHVSWFLDLSVWDCLYQIRRLKVKYTKVTSVFHSFIVLDIKIVLKVKTEILQTQSLSWLPVLFSYFREPCTHNSSHVWHKTIWFIFNYLFWFNRWVLASYGGLQEEQTQVPLWFFPFYDKKKPSTKCI